MMRSKGMVTLPVMGRQQIEEVFSAGRLKWAEGK